MGPAELPLPSDTVRQIVSNLSEQYQELEIRFHGEDANVGTSSKLMIP
jgi:hypothetical protein